VEAVVALEDLAVATSGNYRNYYIKDGKKYTHTISPVTGFPVYHNLLSASVFTEQCAVADAYATAFMVMGLKSAKEILKDHQELEAILIYNDASGEFKTYVTDGISSAIVEDSKE